MVRPMRLCQLGLSVVVLLSAVLLSLQLTAPISAAAPTARQAASYPAISRAEVLQRAQTWLNPQVPYNQQGYNSQGYREDCVGFVSMAWGIPPVGMGNTTLVLGYVTPIAATDLQPGDALLNADGGADPADWRHIVLFAGWANAAHTKYNGYEEDPYYGGAHLTLNMPYPYWPGYDTQGYQPVRYKGIQDAQPVTPDQPAFYAGKIVQWNGDTKPQKTSWLVSADLKRYWIPDINTYYCLRGQGHADAGPISAQLLDQLPDQTGQRATCGSGPTAVATKPASVLLTPTSVPPTFGPPPPTVTPTPTTVPAPPTPTPIYQEEAGPSGSPTFTNYTNAGGTQGPSIAAYGVVQVSCRVQGWQSPTAPAGDNWWYRVQSSPWSNAYYAYADNMYNIWPVSGPFINGVLVDTNVPLC